MLSASLQGPKPTSPISTRIYSLRSRKQAPHSARRVCRASMAADPMHDRKAVTIGEALFDCLAEQLGKSKDEVTSWTPYPGGAPANVATGLARFGAQAIFITALGKDELGEQFMQLLQERKVDTSYMQRSGRPTRDVLVTRSLDGDRTFAGFGHAATTEYADCFLDAQQLPLDVIKAADVLVTGTLGLAYPGSGAAMRKAVAAAKEGLHCTVIIDVNWRPVFWTVSPEEAKQVVLEYIKQATILKVTDEEAEFLYGIPREVALQHPERVLQSAEASTRGVLVSAGEKGSSYAFKGPGGKHEMTGVVPVMDVPVVDTTGAGDAYLSGFIFYMLLSGSLDSLLADPTKLRRAVEFATACGAATCTKPGAIGAQPTVHEVETLLAETSNKTANA